MLKTEETLIQITNVEQDFPWHKTQKNKRAWQALAWTKQCPEPN